MSSRREFKLISFENSFEELDLSCEVVLAGESLKLQYSLSGRVSDVLIPPTSSSPERADELWKQTCFELFLSKKNAEAYFEWNFSPSGDWALYSFDTYRKKSAKAVSLPSEQRIRIEKSANKFFLKTEIKLTGFFADTDNLEFSPTAVLLNKDKTLSYWAISHDASKPDFHLRKSFKQF